MMPNGMLIPTVWFGNPWSRRRESRTAMDRIIATVKLMAVPADRLQAIRDEITKGSSGKYAGPHGLVLEDVIRDFLDALIGEE